MRLSVYCFYPTAFDQIILDQLFPIILMRIVITHTDFGIYWPARIRALQHALEDRGDELFIIGIAGTGSPYGVAADDSAHGESISNWICLFPSARMEDISPTRASGELLAKLDELCPDILMSGSIAYPSGTAAVYWAKQNQKAVIMFDDVGPQDVPRGSLVNYVRQLIYDQVDAVLCPATPWAEGFLKWKFHPEQLFFGVDVVDNDFWDKTSAAMQLPELPVPYFIAVGRQVPVKNFIFLLQAYDHYRKAVAPEDCLSLVIIGEGRERVAMEDFVRNKKLEQVHFLPFLDQRQLRTYYQQAAALVMPGKAETWGLVVNEAMAAGLPVLVSNGCGCAPVLVQEGINGYTFSPEAPDQLLNTLLTFTRLPPEVRAAMGRASRNIIRPWGLDKFVRSCLQALDYAIANKKTCRSIKARFILKNWKGRYRPA